jgi:hypothetical protein
MFNDGSKEWDQLSKGEKFALLVPNAVLFWLGLGLLMVTASCALDSHTLIFRLEVGAMLMAFLMVPVAPFWLVRWHQIKRSRVRLAKRLQEAA